MSNLLSLTSAQLNKAAKLKDQISALEKQLAGILGVATAASTKASGKTKADKSAAPKKRAKMSAAARAHIASIAKARWAKVKAAGKSKL